MSTISDVHEIGIRIGFAYLHGEALTLEYDAGSLEVSGEDLVTAWDEYSLSDPFTIITNTPTK